MQKIILQEPWPPDCSAAQPNLPMQNIVVAFSRPSFSLLNCNEFANRKFAVFFCTLCWVGSLTDD